MGAFDGKVVFITGASSGIGAALARELASEGARVAVAARRKEKLAGLAQAIERAGGAALALDCDVTRDGDVEAAVRATVDKFGKIDVAVANAGIGVSGRVDGLALDDWRRQMETNFFGVLRTVYGVLEEVKRTRGCLVVIGSVNAYLPLPAHAPYAASKFGVRALAEALTEELRPSGVAVVQIQPGFVATEIRGEKDPVPKWLVMPGDVAARKIARAIAGRKRELVLTAHGKLGVWFARHAPWLVRAALRLISHR